MLLAAQSPSEHTYHEDLQLALYQPAAGSKTLLVYVHGGGFSGGSRAEGADYCTYLSERGIACASISYTLYMKGRTHDWSCDGILSEKLKTLQLAASETWAATSYLLGDDSPLKTYPDHVFLAGASAGAEAVLAAGFYDRKELALVDHNLPDDFLYAGIISGAGAMIGLHLIPETNPPALLLFHGTEDPLVPYGTAPHHFCKPDDSGWLLLFGAGALADHYDNTSGNYTLYQHVGAGHGIAGRYFHNHYGATLRFLEDVQSGAQFQSRHQIKK